MNENIESRHAKGTARRRLIQGAFSAPVVLTLHSGSVAAASILCNEKTPSSVPAVTPSADNTYLRYQLWGLEKNGTRMEFDSYYISGSELRAMWPNDMVSPTKDEWQQFDLISTKQLVPDTAKTGEPSKPGYRLTPANQFVALRVGSDGVVVDVGNGGSGFFASESCAGSLLQLGW